MTSTPPDSASPDSTSRDTTGPDSTDHGSAGPGSASPDGSTSAAPRLTGRARSWTFLGVGVLFAATGGLFLATGTNRELRAWVMVAGGAVLALIGLYRLARPGTRVGDEPDRDDRWKWDVGLVVAAVVVTSVVCGLTLGGDDGPFSRPAAFGVGALIGLGSAAWVALKRRLGRAARDAGQRLSESR